MLIYIENGKRKWFIRGEDVPECLWPHDFPLAATYAADLINREHQISFPAAIQADGWINHLRSQWYEVVEHSVRVSRNGILTMLWWKNEKQLLDLSEDE
jgi:hypothetical protein